MRVVLAAAVRRILTRRLVAVGVVLVSVIGVMAPAQADMRRTIAVVGDSISFISDGAIRAAFRYSRVELVAGPGKTMAEMLPALQAQAATNPAAIVIELGTNDAYSDNQNWYADFTNEVNAVQDQRCVIFLTVSSRAGPLADSINAAIFYATVAHFNFHAIDWGDIASTNPAWIGPDGIHPTPAGSTEMAALMHEAVQDDC